MVTLRTSCDVYLSKKFEQLTRFTYGNKYWFHESLILCTAFFLLPKIVEINRVKFNYGRSRLPVLFWCTIKKKYRHITLAKDYTSVTFPKGRYTANMQRFHVFGTWELNFVPSIHVFQFAVQIFIQFYSGEGIYIL